MNTTQRGDRCEVAVLTKCIELGYTVLVPLGTKRYDLAVDTGKRIIRLQCKAGSIREGCIHFHTRSYSGSVQDERYHGEADMFAVYCHETGDVYFMPVEEAGDWGQSLRLDPPDKNRSNIKYAADYRATLV